jgi:hypothetical protein
MLLGNSNLWLNLREIQINSVLLIGQLELFITKNPLYPVLFLKRYCFQLSPRKTHCKFDPRVLGHPVCTYVTVQSDQKGNKSEQALQIIIIIFLSLHHLAARQFCRSTYAITDITIK